MSTNLLEMNHIKKQFDGLQVLKDVSIHVEEGEVLSIIGPSGSGKSTLLRCATLLTRIDGGEISYMGKKAIWTETVKSVCRPRMRSRISSPASAWYSRTLIFFHILPS